MNSILSIDTFCRKLHQFPQIFQEIPILKIIIKRFQIYELILRGLKFKAFNYFNKTFSQLLGLSQFNDILHLFNLIFNYDKSEKILRFFYLDLKSEFSMKMEKELNLLLERDSKLVMIKVHNFVLGNCLPYETTDYSLLDSEIEMFKYIMIQFNKDKRFRNFNDTYKNGNNFWKVLENASEIIQNNNNDIDVEFYSDTTHGTDINIMNSKQCKKINSFTQYGNAIKSFNNNNFLDNPDFFSIVEQSRNNIFYDYNEEEFADFDEIPLSILLGVNEDQLQIQDNHQLFVIGSYNKPIRNYFLLDSSIINILKKYVDKKKEIKFKTIVKIKKQENKLKAIAAGGSEANRIEKDYTHITYRKQNDFLKLFSPKFMKKESIDKMILRKFKKHLSCLIINTPKNKRKLKLKNNFIIGNQKYIKDNFVDEFVTKKLLPPCKYNNIDFKSFNTHYLLWLFSNSAICYLYKEFADAFYLDISNNIINEYNLAEKEPTICDKLVYYIQNLFLFYSKETIEYKDFKDDRIINREEKNNSNSTNKITNNDNLMIIEQNIIPNYSVNETNDTSMDIYLNNSYYELSDSNINNIDSIFPNLKDPEVISVSRFSSDGNWIKNSILENNYIYYNNLTNLKYNNNNLEEVQALIDNLNSCSNSSDYVNNITNCKCDELDCNSEYDNIQSFFN